MTIDCFTFFNELDLLEIRLHSLAPYVDRFVLVESPITHSGKPKPLFFEENKERFKGFNITHIISPPMEGGSWDIEINQRGHILDGIKDADPEDVILISDVDEIPDLRQYDGREGIFILDLFYYYFNCFTGEYYQGHDCLEKEKYP